VLDSAMGQSDGTEQKERVKERAKERMENQLL